MSRIIAREKETKELLKVYKSEEAQFVAVYGRRRIGKTYLIQEFFKGKGHYFELTGSLNANLKEQLRNFSGAYSRFF